MRDSPLKCWPQKSLQDGQGLGRSKDTKETPPANTMSNYGPHPFPRKDSNPNQTSPNQTKPDQTRPDQT